MSQFEKIGLIVIGVVAFVVVTGGRLVAAKWAPEWLVRLMTPPVRR
jgi:hypothetical protein